MAVEKLGGGTYNVNIVSIHDGLGRTVCTARIESHLGTTLNALVTWNCTRYDSVVTMSGFGDVVETIGVEAAAGQTKTHTDGASRALQTIDALSTTTGVLVQRICREPMSTSRTRLLVPADSNNTSKCSASLKTIFKLDVRDIGADEEIISGNIGSVKPTGVICLDLQIVVHVIGFGGVVHLTPMSSRDITASDASRLIREMRPPVSVF